MKKIISFMLILAVVVAVASHFGITDMLLDVNALRLWLEGFGWWSYIIFILLAIFISVFMLPGQLLAIVGGLLYGGFIGGALTIIGATLGSSLSFIIGKYIARDYVIEKFGQTDIFKKIEQGVTENGITFLIFTRMVPIFPYAIQSYAYALTPMSLKKFSLVSFITMMPASFIYAYMASEIAVRGFSKTLVIELAIAGIILTGLSYLPKRLNKKLGQLSTEYRKGNNK